jgi:hypothetical protein
MPDMSSAPAENPRLGWVCVIPILCIVAVTLVSIRNINCDAMTRSGHDIVAPGPSAPHAGWPSEGHLGTGVRALFTPDASEYREHLTAGIGSTAQPLCVQSVKRGEILDHRGAGIGSNPMVRLRSPI